jgi:hypothetical protein
MKTYLSIGKYWILIIFQFAIEKQKKKSITSGS